MAGSTGQGTTVAFSVAGTQACVRSITLPEWSLESIDASCLNDVGFMKKISGDLVDPGTVEVVVVFELDDDFTVPDGTDETLTITFPTAGATPGTLVGSGFVSSVSLPSVEINGLLEQTITFTFDGETGPAWTAGTIT